MYEEESRYGVKKKLPFPFNLHAYSFMDLVNLILIQTIAYQLQTQHTIAFRIIKLPGKSLKVKMM